MIKIRWSFGVSASLAAFLLCAASTAYADGATTTGAWGAPYQRPVADVNTAVIETQAEQGIFNLKSFGVAGQSNQYNGPTSISSAVNIGNENNVSATAQNGVVTVGTAQDSSGSSQSANSAANAISGKNFNAANILTGQ